MATARARVGLQIATHQGLLHSEAFREFDQADNLRGLIWKRMESLMHNHGLVRAWTVEKAPYWRNLGFQLPPQEILPKLPPHFGDAQAGWQFIQLRAERTAAAVSPDAEFAMFKEAAKAETDKVLKQARC